MTFSGKIAHNLKWILHNLIYLVIALTAIAIVSCRSSSKARPLEIPDAAIYKALKGTDSDPAFTNSEKLPHAWWLLFEDMQLNNYIEKTFKNNPTLHAAQARIMSASYAAYRARASLFPSLTWAADASRQKLSKTGVIPFNTGSPSGGGPPIVVPVTPGATGGIPVYFSLYETEATLSYEFDFWKKNSNTLRAALGIVQSNIAEEAFTKLNLGIAVAKIYFDLQVDYQRQKIAQALVDNKAEYSNTLLRRFNANIGNEISLKTSEAALTEAKLALLKIQGDAAVKEYQLKAYLADDFEEEILKSEVIEQPLPRIPLPRDIPLHLIGQRPDIIAQLWLIESAGKLIDVARAGFYPDFNLSAFFGYQTIHFRELFKWPSSYFNVDQAVTLPIFDGGKLLANLRSSEVNYDLAIFHYNELILKAAEEVLESLAILRNTLQQLEELTQKLQYQQEINALMNLRVSHNLNSVLDKLMSEGDVLLAQDENVIGIGQTIQAILDLIKALGGGYDRCDEG